MKGSSPANFESSSRARPVETSFGIRSAGNFVPSLSFQFCGSFSRRLL